MKKMKGFALVMAQFAFGMSAASMTFAAGFAMHANEERVRLFLALSICDALIGVISALAAGLMGIWND